MNDGGGSPMQTHYRVLVVDDNLDEQMLMKQLFYDSIIEIQTALYGPTALVMLRETHFDLMITDLTLPEMDGVELIRRVRAIDMNLPILINSWCHGEIRGDEVIFQGYRGDFCLEKHLFDGFITKPIDRDIFPEIISHVLKNHRRGQDFIKR